MQHASAWMQQLHWRDVLPDVHLLGKTPMVLLWHDQKVALNVSKIGLWCREGVRFHA